MLEDMLLRKTTLTVNAMAVKAANTSYLSPGAHVVLVHAHIKTPLTTTGTQVLFVVNSIKLHLTASYSTVMLSTFCCPVVVWSQL